MPNQPWKPKSSFTGQETVAGMDNKIQGQLNNYQAQPSFTPGIAQASRMRRPMMPGANRMPARPNIPGAQYSRPNVNQHRPDPTPSPWDYGSFHSQQEDSNDDGYGTQYGALDNGQQAGSQDPYTSSINGQQQGQQQQGQGGYYEGAYDLMNTGAPVGSQENTDQMIAEEQLKLSRQFSMQERQMREAMAARGGSGFGLGAGQEFLGLGDIEYNRAMGMADISMKIQAQQDVIALENYWKQLEAQFRAGDASVAAELAQAKIAYDEAVAKALKYDTTTAQVESGLVAEEDYDKSGSYYDDIYGDKYKEMWEE